MPLREDQFELSTSDGAMTTLAFHPAARPRGIVIFYMDAVGIRDELKDMARRLGHAGYLVVLPDLYHRLGTLISFKLGKGPMDEEAMAEIIRHIRSVTNERAMEDTRAVLNWTDSQKELRGLPVGAVGYCMGGPFAFMAASRFPDRVAAAASIYGVGCISGETDSPHLQAGKVRGELYFAYAERDTHAPPSEVEPLGKVLSDAGVTHQIEVYHGVDHGFAFPERPVYDKAASERHWERLLSLFDKKLR